MSLFMLVHTHGSWRFDGSHTCSLVKCASEPGKYFDGSASCGKKDCVNKPKVVKLNIDLLYCH